MDVIIVDAIAELKFTVLPSVKGGEFIFRSDVFVPPGIKRFNGVHPLGSFLDAKILY
jgi:hypothetical protein